MKRIAVILVILFLSGLCFGALAETKLGLDASIFTELVSFHSTVPQPLPANWQDRYVPAGGSMNTNRTDSKGSLNLGIGFEPKLITANAWEFGLPIFYIFPFDQEVAETKVDWWDPVPVLKVKVRKTTPAIGISVRKGDWKAQYTIQKYNIFLEEFRGIDHYGAPNEAEVIGKSDIGSGCGQRFGISYIIDERGPKGSWAKSIDGFYERDGSQVWCVGFCFKYTYVLH